MSLSSSYIGAPSPVHLLIIAMTYSPKVPFGLEMSPQGYPVNYVLYPKTLLFVAGMSLFQLNPIYPSLFRLHPF